MGLSEQTVKLGVSYGRSPQVWLPHSQRESYATYYRCTWRYLNYATLPCVCQAVAMVNGHSWHNWWGSRTELEWS